MHTQTHSRFGRRDRTAPTDQGFTLIELVVVVIIIGILAAIAIPIFSNQRARGHDAQVQAQVKNIVTAVELALHDDAGGDLAGDHTTGQITAGTGTPAPVTTTDGVEWTVSGSARGYCIAGWATERSRFTASAPLVYDSTVGKTLPAGAECTPIAGTPGGPGGPGDGGGGGQVPPGDGDGSASYTTLISFTYDLTAPGCTDTTITLPLDGVTGDAQVDWGDGEGARPFTTAAGHYYATTATYTVTVTDARFTSLSRWEAYDDAPCLISVDTWEGDTGPVNLAFAFEGATNLERVATPPVPITGLAGAFMGAESFNQDMTGWDVSGVTDFGGVFAGAASFNGDVSGWDTSNATTMNAMFSHATAFNQDLSGWDTSSVTDVSSMFMNATAFNGDVSTWDTSSVTTFYGAFEDATSFNQDLSGWDLTSAETLARMFAGATSFNQDLSGWDAPNAWDTWGMDDGATAWEAHHKPAFL